MVRMSDADEPESNGESALEILDEHVAALRALSPAELAAYVTAAADQSRSGSAEAQEAAATAQSTALPDELNR